LYYSIVVPMSFLIHDIIVPYFIHLYVDTSNTTTLLYTKTSTMTTWNTTTMCVVESHRYYDENDDIDSTMTCSVDTYEFYNDVVVSPDEVTSTHPNHHNNYNQSVFWLGVWFLSYAIWIFIWRLYCRLETPIHYNNHNNTDRNLNDHSPSNNNNIQFSSSQLQQQLVLQSPQYPYIILYEYCWLCNVTLMITGIAFVLPQDRSSMIFAYIILIGIDQLLWYIDLLIYIGTGHCPIGVAKYVFTTTTTTTSSNTTNTGTDTTKVSHNQNKNTNQTTKNICIKHMQQQHWSNRITWTHHLWTIPLVLHGCQYQIHFVSYLLSILYLFLHVCLSRYLIPSHIVIPALSAPSSDTVRTTRTTDSHKASSLSTSDIAVTNNDRRNSYRHELYYLNINLSYEVYKDVQHIPFLRIPTTKHWYQYMLALVWRWQCFNTIVYMIYYYICKNNTP
jgi:hypothetical protein